MERTSIPRRILVVDDEPLVRDALRTMLLFDGHQVKAVANGKEALMAFEKGKFDLVITDYTMPGIHGDELAAIIKAWAPEQPVVMITAHAESLTSSNKPMAAVDRIIGKPFSLQIMREAIEQSAASSAIMQSF